MPRKPSRLAKIAILGPDFLGALVNFRTLWIRGRYGGGKTALATILGAWLVWAGHADDVVANYPTAIANPAPAPPLKRTAIIIDESWQFAAVSTAVEKYSGFLRKLGNFLLLPSVFPVHSRFSSFSVERFFSSYVIGIPAWIFRWDLRRFTFRDQGYFIVINPHLVFNVYDTYAVTLDDGGIADLLEATYLLEGRREQSTPDRRSVPPPPPPPERRQLGGLEQAAKEIGEAVSTFDEQLTLLTETISAAGRRRR